jgi:hypothetical protein
MSIPECLLVRPERRWSSAKVIEALADVMLLKGVPEHIRSDNSPEFVARDLRTWLAATGAKTLYIEPAVPGRTATVRASTLSCATSSSTGRYSTRSRSCRSWQNVGGVTTTPFVHTPRWGGHELQDCAPRSAPTASALPGSPPTWRTAIAQQMAGHESARGIIWPA